jgi:hypothetical protein
MDGICNFIWGFWLGFSWLGFLIGVEISVDLLGNFDCWDGCTELSGNLCKDKFLSKFDEVKKILSKR